MKYLVLLMMMGMMLQAEVDCSTHPIYCQIKKNSPRIDKAYAMELSNLIFKYSKQYNIPANVYAAILMQESSYRLNTINEYCGPTTIKNNNEVCVLQDFGISQINYKTAQSYGFDAERLTTDLEYSVEAGAKVLAWFNRRYSQKEPNRWFVRYNCGTNPNSHRYVCNQYLKSVKRWK